MVMSLSVGSSPLSKALLDSSATKEVYLPMIWFATPRRTASFSTNSPYFSGGWVAFTNSLLASLAWFSQPWPSSSSRIARLAASEWIVVPVGVSGSVILR